MKKLSVACDHAGVTLKNEIIIDLKVRGWQVIDHGTDSTASVDYPDFAALVAGDVQSKKCDCGILICGTGIGMAIAANKFKGVRAASLTDIYSTRLTRQHNDLNVLCLGARVIGTGMALAIVDTFLNTGFEGGRHQKRVEKMMGSGDC